MTVLTVANVIPKDVWGDANLKGLFSLRNVTSGDTIDLASVSQFQIVKSGVVLGESDFVEIAASFEGTVVTMPGGLTHSSGYLLVLGC